MIKLLRVDHGLLHSRVVLTWVSALRPNCILLANDSLVTDEMRKTTLRLSRPSGVKLVIKSVDASIAALSAGRADKYELMVITANVADAVRLALAIDQVKEINLGATRASAQTRPISETVNLSSDDVAFLGKATAQGIDVYIQQLPGNHRQPFCPEKKAGGDPWEPRGSPLSPHSSQQANQALLVAANRAKDDEGSVERREKLV